MNDPEDHEALNRFRASARNIESAVEADHNAGRIGEGDYLAVMEQLHTMFRRVPDNA
jgi:hypothetical protein